MNIFKRYEKEFKQLVDTTYQITHQRTITATDSYSKALALSLSQEKLTKIDKKEIEQQLALFWVEWFDAFRSKKSKINLRNYLLRRSVWGLRDWIKHESSRPESVPLVEQATQMNLKAHLFDLHWLLHGDKEDGPLYMLTAYERYLLFLRFVQGYKISEISTVLRKSDKTVRTKLTSTINMIRSHSND